MGLHPKVVKGILSLAGGASVYTIGSALAGPAEGAALTAIVQFFGKSVVQDIGKKAQEFIIKKVLDAGWDSVASRLDFIDSDAGMSSGMPAGYDLLRAMRQAYLLGLLYCVGRCTQDMREHSHEFEVQEVDVQIKNVSQWIKHELKALEAEDYFEGLALRPSLADISQKVASAKNDAQAQEIFAGLFESATESAIAELTDVLSCPLLQPIRNWILGYDDAVGGQHGTYKPGWSMAAAAFFAEMVKKQPELRAVIFTEQLQALLGGQQDLQHALDEGLDKVSKSASNLSDQLEELKNALDTLRDERRLVESADYRKLLQAVAEEGFSVDALIDRLRVEFPRGTQWSQTASQVRERFAQLRSVFIGRESDLQKLDDFLANNPRGLLVVAAPAGYGKSALMAAWVEHRAQIGDRVVRHFISNLYDKTTQAADILGHLLAQLRDTGELLESADALGQALHQEISECMPDERKLIIVVDGLDEALTVVPAFVETDLPQGVFVVVSCRAEEKVWPSPLRPWQERINRGLPWDRYDVGQMGPEEVESWLVEELEAPLVGELHGLAERLLRTSEGIPLFLQYLIADLAQRIRKQQGLPQESWSEVSDQLPESFTKYVHQQFDQLSYGGDAVWSQAYRSLLATLCRTFGPIRQTELERVLVPCPNLAALDHRIRRWLSVRTNGSERQFAFALAHPRLVQPLGDYFGEQADQAEERLVEWANQAWHPKETIGRRPGSDYALDWLPSHLMRLNEKQAEQLLRDPAFLAARLQTPDQALARLKRSVDEWLRLSPTIRQSPDARLWTAFWAENEVRLRAAIGSRPLPDSRSPASVVLDCLGDAGLSKSPRACIPHRIPERGLIRLIDDAHEKWINGVLQVGERLVSWDDDGALRFWSLEGERLPGGADDAHKAGINGVLQVGERLVSWGADEVLRFWTLAGEYCGALAVPDRGWVERRETNNSRLVVCGRTLWVYRLTNGLPWKG